MKILLHFGFPKTMSSSLQFGLFKPLHDRNMVNLKTWRQDDCNEHMDLRPSSRLFNNQEILNPYLDFKDNILNILSDEGFTYPIKVRRNNYGNNIEDPLLFPKKIKEQISSKYGNNIEFIPFITIRNQVDLMYSLYVEEYNLKKYKDIDILFDDKKRIDLTGFGVFNFYRYISTLESVFGKGKSNIFFFEDWINDFDSCCDRLANLMEIEPNIVRNFMLDSHVNKKKKSSKGYYVKDGSVLIPFLTSSQKQQILSFFEKDNLKLQKFFGPEIDLVELQYLN